VDLAAMYQSHVNSNALATLVVNHRPGGRQLLFNKEERLCGWRNQETGEVKSSFPDFDPSNYLEYAFGGIHVISPEVFTLIEEWTGKFSIINFYLSICPFKPVRFYTEKYIRLIDAGKAEGLEEVERWLSKPICKNTAKYMDYGMDTNTGDDRSPLCHSQNST
jgi:hypothetical protein